MIRAAVLTLALAVGVNLQPICRVSTTDKVIALTFDDGPHPKYTEQILDVLDEYGVKATFFVIGENVRNYPGIVEEETARGHEVESHTFSHRYANSYGYGEAVKELSSNEDALGVKTSFVRPPGGIVSSSFKRAAGDMSYRIVLWSVDTLDWKCPGADHIVNTVLNNAKSGDIILMHDYVCGHSSTVEALKRVIPSLIERGYTFVTIKELLGE